MTAAAWTRRIKVGRCLFGVLLLAASADAHSAFPSLTHLRPANPRLERAVARGGLESPTFRAMLESIEASSAFVYVLEVPDLPPSLHGCVPLDHGGSTSVRYFRVLIHAGRPDSELTPLIGHELRHVLEMLEHLEDPERPAPGAWRVGPYQFETQNAVDTELRILKELKSRSIRSATMPAK